MNFQQAIASGFSNYVTFLRPRSAFGILVLDAVRLHRRRVATGILDAAIFPDSMVSPFNAISTLILFLPGLAMWVRRLHDIDRTGWWLLIALTIIGVILLIVWACMKGTSGSNRFGHDPLGRAAATGADGVTRSACRSRRPAIS